MKTLKIAPTLRSGLAIVALCVTLVGLGLTPIPARAAAALAVVPNHNFDTEGNTNNSIPFGSDTFCTDGIRYQQLYDGSQVGGPNIGSMAFRLDINSEDTGPISYTGVTVTLSSTLATYATMSLTFADNIGPDAAVVYSGDLMFEPSVTGVSDPNPFDFEINFDTPFPFDGSGANLLVDITIEGCHDGPNFFFDAEEDDNAVTRIFAEDKDDLVGDDGRGAGVAAVGLVTQFFIFSDGVVYIPLSMGSGGNWTVVGHNGEGFLFEPLTSGHVVIFWFTYDLFGNQMWLLGVAQPGDFQNDPASGQDVATVMMYRTSGPSFGPDFDPADYQEDYIGNITVRLNACLASEGATGEVDYNFDFGFGVGTYGIAKLYDIYKNDCDP